MNRCPFCRRDNVPDLPAHYAKGPATCPALAAAFDPPLSRSEQSQRTWDEWRAAQPRTKGRRKR